MVDERIILAVPKTTGRPANEIVRRSTLDEHTAKRLTHIESNQATDGDRAKNAGISADELDGDSVGSPLTRSSSSSEWSGAPRSGLKKVALDDYTQRITSMICS